MTRAVFYTEPEDLRSLAPGDTYVLGGQEGHHAKTVKRIEPGEAVDLVDGQGMRVTAEVVGAHPDGLELAAVGAAVEDRGSRVTLVQALAKGDRDLMAIEMATELGAEGIVPWQAERCIVRWKGDRADKAHGKWVKTVRAAAKQARRSRIPEVEPLAETKNLAQIWEPGDTVLLLHEEAEDSLSAVVKDLPETGRVFVLVGPEGGISPREVEDLRAAGARPVLLGSDVLRSSTAGAAAISLVNAASGYWTR